MSIPRRLGRLARGFVTNLDEERLRETIRTSRERSETLKEALGAAWRGAAEEWRIAEERRAAEERTAGERAFEERDLGGRFTDARVSSGRTREQRAPRYVPRRYPPEVLAAYRKLGLDAGSSLEEVHRKRRELVKRHHPDRFVDPEQRRRAERVTAEVNAAHDTVERYLLRG